MRLGAGPGVSNARSSVTRRCRPAPAADVTTMSDKLRAGGYGWGHAKQALFDVLDARFAEPRRVYAELRANEPGLDAILADGAARAHEIARRTIARVREAVGTA